MPNPLLQSIFDQLAEPFTGEALFDAQADLVYFIKDAAGRYALVNHTLAQRCAVANKSELIGRTAADVFPAPLGENYLAQDLAILATGQPLLNELELHAYPTGEQGWCITTKLPLRSRGDRCAGLVGISRDLHAPTDGYRDVAEALRKAQSRLDSPMTIDDLAQIAGLSTFQFDHRIKEVFHVSASQLILKFRMDLAVQRLRDTSLPIAQIAFECGYSDQSAFTRQFHRTVGLTPSQYRKRTLGSGSP